MRVDSVRHDEKNTGTETIPIRAGVKRWIMKLATKALEKTVRLTESKSLNSVWKLSTFSTMRSSKVLQPSMATSIAPTSVK